MHADPASSITSPQGDAAAPSSSSSSSSLPSVGTFTPYHFTAFLAMETPVTIIPRFSMDAIEVFGASASMRRGRQRRWWGPFVELYPIEVPLYLALHLRLTGTCTIPLPSYLTLESLEAVVEREQADESNFEPLPFFFFEIAKKLLEAVGSDAQGAENHSITEVTRLVRDIHLIRQQKLQRSMSIFEGLGSSMSIPGIKLTNIAANELEFLRCSFAVVLYQAHRMEQLRTARVDRIVRPTAATSAGSAPHGSSSVALSETPRLPRGSLLQDSADFSPQSDLSINTQQQQQQQQRGSSSGSRWGVGLFPESESLSMGMTGPSPSSLLASSQPSTITTTTTTGGEGDAVGGFGDTPLRAPPPAKKRRILRQT